MAPYLEKPAAILAQLVDVRNIGVHKAIKLTLHIPVEQATEVMQMFGWPTMVDPIPVAIARLRPSGVVEAPSTPAPAPEKFPPTTPARATNRLITRAAILCDDEMFQLWLRQEKKRTEVFDRETAAIAMRHLLGIISRKEIIPGSDVEARYNKLVAEYEAWAHPDILDETPEVASLP